MAEANQQKAQQKPIAQPVQQAKPFPSQPGQKPLSPQPIQQQAQRPIQQPAPQQIKPIAQPVAQQAQPPVQAPPVQRIAPVQAMPVNPIAPQIQQAPAPKKEESFFAKLLGTSKQEELKKVELQTAYKPIFKIAFPDNIPVLPDPKDITTINVRYRVIEPFVDIHIYWDAPNNELAYEVEEPKLTEEETKNLRLLEEGLTELINISYINIEDMNIVIEFLEKTLKILLDEFGIKVSEDTFLKYMYFLYRDLIGMNQVEPLLKDYFIEDIECNGFGTPIYIVHRKYRNLRTNIIFHDIRSLSGFVEKLAQKCSQYVSYANPLLDGVLPDGSRVNATYTEDVTSRGPTFCITGGKVQLEGGIVKEIGDLFIECRENFECIEDNGDEIVELKGVKACGVMAENLAQMPANITKIMKLKPPKELVSVELKDGARLCVTKNHLFHVADETLRLVQAADLKEGMLVPVPSMVACEGIRQTIDVWRLLKEFSMQKKVCIVSSEAVKNLVSLAAGSGKYCARAAEYGVHESYFYEVISRGCSISFNVLDRICAESNSRPESLGEVRIVVYGGGSKGKPKDISIPRAVDEDLAYLAGAIISDGHLSRANIDVSCFEEGFRDAVKSLLVSKFGNCETYYGGNRVYLCNLFFPYFFNKVFGIQFGKKSSVVQVPDIIFRSDNKVVASFVRGLFDGDGTCSSGLSYKTNSAELAEGLSYLLARLGIYCYLDNKNRQYRLTIPSLYESQYSDLIGFNNKFKAEKLKLLLEKKIERKSHIHYGRIPAKPVLSLLKDMGISKNSIIKMTGVNYNRLVYYDTISKPFANKIADILEVKFREGTRFKVSHLARLNYIKWLANNGYEYVKVKKVEICSNTNKLPVYDIELEPCKFYIGGNKPLVLFDTLRKFTKEPWTPIKLMDFRTVSPEILAYLWLLIDNKSNILIIGGTGSGKTSFLNAMAFFIPPAARVVSIEDTRELNLRHENWLPAVSRQGAGNASITGEKHGEVSLFDLLKESLRQRPDYIIVGEIRGKEAFVLFQGMASLRGSEKVTILDDNQLKRIPIAELKNNSRLQAPTIDPITEKATTRPVAFVETHPPRKDLIRIKTKTGREVTVTPEHSVFTYTNKLEVIEAGKLKKGSKIAVPGKIPCGYLDIGHISLLDYLPLIRVHAPNYVKMAVKKLGFDTASGICGVSAISDYYANFSRSKPSSLRADKFVKLMAMAGIKYDTEEILAKFDKKSKLLKPILPVSPELLRLMGYFISDGSLHESGKMRAICLYNKNPEILEDMRKCILGVAGEMPKERECTSGFGRATELSISHMVLFEFIKKSCGKSKEKKIPPFMLGLSKEKIGEFLSALYAGDGSLKESHFGYYTISRDIADMLVHLLLAFGIVATVRQRKRNGRKTTDYEIMIYGRKEKDEFLKYVHPVGKPILLKAPERKFLKKRFNDVFVDTVVSIEKIKLRNAEPVYDISVPKAETFIGGFGGVLLHNTGHPSFGTFHAESTNSVIKRLMMPPINLSPAMIEALDALCIITPARVGGKEVRRISEIDELVSVSEKGDATINVPFVRDPAKDTFLFKTSSKVFEKIMKRTGMTWKELSKEFENRTRLLMEMYRRKIFGFAEVQDIIHEYSKRPEQVLKRFGLAK